jgi:hypothetical protein
MKAKSLIFGLFFYVTAFSAEPTPAQKAVYSLILDADLGASAIMLGSMGNDLATFEKASADLGKQVQAIDLDVAAAVKATNKKPDVVKAVKDFYGAASTYLSNGIPTSRMEKAASDRLKAEMDGKEKALKLEMKLAGLE